MGLCTGTNLAASKATKNFILYSHDDMYFCPGWDKILKNEVDKINSKLFYLSGTMIEQNSGHIPYDCGDTYENFDENKLLKNFKNLKYHDYQGSHWAPHLIHKDLWNKIGGFSEEFNPGIGSDPDLNMKLWNEGVRIFKGLEKFKVYHFGSISLRKKNDLKVNKGSRTFLRKWGFTTNFFLRHFLDGEKYEKNKIVSKKYLKELDNPKITLSYLIDFLFSKFKYFYLILFKKND